MSRHPMIFSLSLVALLGACSQHQPPEPAPAATPPPAAPAKRAPQAGEPGAAVNSLLTDAQLRALQKARAIDPQVMRQKDDMDKKIDEDSGKN